MMKSIKSWLSNIVLFTVMSTSIVFSFGCGNEDEFETEVSNNNAKGEISCKQTSSVGCNGECMTADGKCGTWTMDLSTINNKGCYCNENASTDGPEPIKPKGPFTSKSTDGPEPIKPRGPFTSQK